MPLLSEEGCKGDAGSGSVLAGTLKGDRCVPQFHAGVSDRHNLKPPAQLSWGFFLVADGYQ